MVWPSIGGSSLGLLTKLSILLKQMAALPMERYGPEYFAKRSPLRPFASRLPTDFAELLAGPGG